MDLVDQRFLDVLLERHDATSGVSPSRCTELRSAAGDHLREAGRVLGAIGEALVAHVAEVPNDILSLVTGVAFVDDEEDSEDSEGGKDFAKKRSPFSAMDMAAAVFLGQEPVGSPKQDYLASMATGKGKAPVANVCLDAPCESLLSWESERDLPSSLSRRLEASMNRSKNKRE